LPLSVRNCDRNKEGGGRREPGRNPENAWENLRKRTGNKPFSPQRDNAQKEEKNGDRPFFVCKGKRGKNCSGGRGKKKTHRTTPKRPGLSAGGTVKKRPGQQRPAPFSPERTGSGWKKVNKKGPPGGGGAQTEKRGTAPQRGRCAEKGGPKSLPDREKGDYGNFRGRGLFWKKGPKKNRQAHME